MRSADPADGRAPLSGARHLGQPSVPRRLAIRDMHLVPAFNSLPVSWSPTRAVGWVAANLMKPKSHGRVWLRAADPATLPRIDAGLLAHPDRSEEHTSELQS